MICINCNHPRKEHRATADGSWICDYVHANGVKCPCGGYVAAPPLQAEPVSDTPESMERPMSPWELVEKLQTRVLGLENSMNQSISDILGQLNSLSAKYELSRQDIVGLVRRTEELQRSFRANETQTFVPLRDASEYRCQNYQCGHTLAEHDNGHGRCSPTHGGSCPCTKFLGDYPIFQLRDLKKLYEGLHSSADHFLMMAILDHWRGIHGKQGNQSNNETHGEIRRYKG